MKNKLKQPVVFILIYTLTGIITPLILRFAVFENHVYSNLSNEGWAGFLGSYVGGVLGGLGTLIAMYVTMKNSMEVQAENKNDTDQQIQENNRTRQMEYQRDKTEREAEYRRDKMDREAERKADAARREQEIRETFANGIAESLGKYITYISKYHYACIHGERLDEELRSVQDEVRKAEWDVDHAPEGKTKESQIRKLESVRIRLDMKEREVRENRSFGNRLDANEAYFIIKTKLSGNLSAKELTDFMGIFHREAGNLHADSEYGSWLDEKVDVMLKLFDAFRERYVGRTQS